MREYLEKLRREQDRKDEIREARREKIGQICGCLLMAVMFAGFIAASILR